jgi:hypothetical protein
MLAQASGRENRSVHIRKDSVIVVKENTAVCVLQTESHFPYWKFDIMRPFTSMHHFHRHIAHITHIIISFHYFAQ